MTDLSVRRFWQEMRAEFQAEGERDVVELLHDVIAADRKPAQAAASRDVADQVPTQGQIKGFRHEVVGRDANGDIRVLITTPVYK